MPARGVLLFFCVLWFAGTGKAGSRPGSIFVGAEGGNQSRRAGAKAGSRMIHWHAFEDALGEAQREKKTAIVVIQKPWCAACVELMKTFAESAEVRELSEHFVMVQLDSEEKTGRIFQLDGKYYPRVYFLDHTGKILDGLQNFGGSSSAKYSFTSARELVEAMRRALDLLQHHGEL
jgi:hypothetical protein